MLDEGALLLAPAAFHDLLENGVPGAAPLPHVGGPAEALGQAQPLVEGDPAHHAAVCEVLAAAAGLPDALVRPVPVVGEPVQRPGQRLPSPVRGLLRDLQALGHRGEGLAVDVQLELVDGAVADADGGGAAIALEVFECLLRQVGIAVDPVHRLERLLLLALALVQPVDEPVDEGGGLLYEAEVQHGPHGQRAVAHPGEPVVPVALSADLLGQAHGRRRDEGAGGSVGEELERDDRTVHQLGPAAPVAGLAQPALPETGGLIVLCGEPVDREGCGCLAAGRADGEHDAARLAGAQRHPAAYVLAVPLQREGGLQVRVHPRGPENTRVLAELQLVLCPAVVEARAALEREVDGPPHGPHDAYQGVTVGGGAGPVRRHEVDHLAHPVR